MGQVSVSFRRWLGVIIWVMKDAPPHLKSLEEIERECIPGLVEILRWEGIEAVRYAFFDMTNWHAEYDPSM